MFRYTEKKSIIFSIIATVLTILVLVSQFTPFWAYNSETKKIYTAEDTAKLEADLEAQEIKMASDPKAKETVFKVSVQEYVWMINEHKALTNAFKALDKELNLNDFVTMPVLTLVSALLAVIFLIFKSDNPIFAAIFAFASGVSGIVFSFTSKFMDVAIGSTLFTIIASAASLVIGAYLLVLFVSFLRKEFAK
ncbi:MAG: hypothetical protein J6K84_01470 [Oscillospiraceae bacterium]|nr:hypothetical protein [Oscillospiraceae bacterium]